MFLSRIGDSKLASNSNHLKDDLELILWNTCHRTTRGRMLSIPSPYSLILLISYLIEGSENSFVFPTHLVLFNYFVSEPEPSRTPNRVSHNSFVIAKCRSKGECFDEKKIDSAPVVEEIRLGYETPVQLLLDIEEVNALRKNGWTPLHVAIVRKSKNASIQLLGAGTDPNLSVPLAKKLTLARPQLDPI